MVTLTRLLGAVLRWFAGSRRRQIAVLVLPLLVAVAVLAPRTAGSQPPASSSRLAGEPAPPAGAETGTDVPSATIPPGTGLPGTTGPAPGPSVPSRPAAVLPAAAVKVATDYVRTVNTHDARPGKDRGFLDSYRRARPYLTPELFALVTAPSQRGDYEWAQWQRAQATVAVEVQRVALPDGAPLPTATTAYLRLQYRQVVTPHAAGGSGGAQPDMVTLVATRTGATWLVSRLLADT